MTSPTTPSAEALADDSCCKECGGAGHVRAMTSHLGPDDYEYDETCAVCAGSGAADLKEVIESLSYFERPLFPNGALVPYVKRSEVLKVIAARATLEAEPKAQAQAAETLDPENPTEAQKQECVAAALAWSKKMNLGTEGIDEGLMGFDAGVKWGIQKAQRSTASVRQYGLAQGLHPATADLVSRFAWALSDKLRAAEEKYGYSDGWASSDWMDECRMHLREHIEKGDPRDVAAYCAFLWHHGASTANPGPKVPTDEALLALVPWEIDTSDATEEAIDRRLVLKFARSVLALSAPSPEARETAEPALDLDCLKEQANAWLMVLQTLDEVAPRWVEGPLSGQDSACAAIRRLAAQPAVEKAEPALWQWRRKRDPWTLEHTYNTPVIATTDDSEVRMLYAAPVSQAEPVPPLDVQEAARRFVANDYRGPLASARRVFDWVHSLKPPFTDPMFQAEPSTSHEEKGQG